MFNRKPYFATWLVISVLLLSTVGCGSLSYYGQAAKGQWDILVKRTNIQNLLDEPNSQLSEQEKAQLALVLEIRYYAAVHFKMPVGKAYSRYVDTGKSHVVWNVFAAPELSLEAKRWCYPIAGCSSYRGYFAKQDALDYAEALKAKGYETFVGGVRAYSTLGWFEDPVLNTFLNQSDIQLAALLFHELAHRILYIPGDTDFNESFATALSDFAVAHWLNTEKNRYSEDQYQAYLLRRVQLKQFYAILQAHRIQLEELYHSEITDSAKRQAKEQLRKKLEMALSEFDHTNHQQTSLATSQTTRQSQFSRWALNANNAKWVTVNSYQKWVTAITSELYRNLDNECERKGDRTEPMKKSSLENSCELGITLFHQNMKNLKSLNQQQRTKILEEWQSTAGHKLVERSNGV